MGRKGEAGRGSGGVQMGAACRRDGQMWPEGTKVVSLRPFRLEGKGGDTVSKSEW